MPLSHQHQTTVTYQITAVKIFIAHAEAYKPFQNYIFVRQLVKSA